MKSLIGQKIGMSQMFGERGRVSPVTLLAAGPNTVTQVKDVNKDGYMAVQLGYGNAKKAAKAKAKYKYLREFRLDPDSEAGAVKPGQKLDVSQFAAGDKVTLIAVSRGKGFAGTIKRYNFSRGPKTHGGRNYRRPGSIGSMYPQKVFKGKKMAGRMGGNRITLKKVQVTAVDKEKNILVVKGQVPGPRNGLVLIKG